MPGMNGYQLMREVRKTHPNQMFIIASSSPEIDSKKEFACLYFTKPVSADSLQDALLALSQCYNYGPHAKCLCAEACVPDNRQAFNVDSWRCPRISP